MRLELELVPSDLWGRNLRTKLKPREWRAVRLDALSRANNTCGICGAKIGDEGVTKLLCHEQWEYNDTLHIQKLVGLVITCFMCNLVNHSGMASEIRDSIRVTPKDIMDHFLKINNCTEKDYREHKREAFSKWRERDKEKWEQDYSFFEELYPQELLDKRVEVVRDMEKGTRETSNKKERERRKLFRQVIKAQKAGLEVTFK